MTNINNGVLDGVRRIGAAVRSLSITGGISGAPLGVRLLGATQSGPPTAGTWKAGDQVSDRNGNAFICTAGGTGSGATWVLAGVAWAAVSSAMQHGYATWTFDWYNSPGGSTATYLSGLGNGILHLTRMFFLPYAQTLLGNLDTCWGAGSGTAGANTYIGVYQLTGGNAVLVGSGSADLSSHGNAIITVSTGVTNWAAGWYALGYCVGTQYGTNASAPWKNNSSLYNATAFTAASYLPGDPGGALNAPIANSVYYSGGYTALPSSVALSNFSKTNEALMGALR